MLRNPHLYPNFSGDITAKKNGRPEPSAAAHDRTQAGPPRALAKRIRQSSKPKMNKLELEFFEKLKQDYGSGRDVGGSTFSGFEILCQAVRLELANGQWYKPDFFIPSAFVRHADWDKSVAYEVKGPHAFRGGFENLKTAARVHQWCKFYLVWKEGQEWKRQEVLP